MLNFCDFIQVFVFTTNHHIKPRAELRPKYSNLSAHLHNESDFLFSLFFIPHASATMRVSRETTV